MQNISLAVLFLTVAVPATAVAASSPCVPRPITANVSVPATPEPAHQTPTVIASLNLAGQARIRGELVLWAQQRKIDILLLQEVGHPSNDGAAFAATLSEQLGFQFAYAPATVIDETASQGLAIVSRYPLEDIRVYPLKYHHLRFRSRCRVALTAKAMTGAGWIQVVNVHLDTRINSQDRVDQLAPILEDLAGVRLPQIIGGDFNTMNIGWFRTMWPFPYFQHQSRAVQGLLSADGFYTPLINGPATFTFLGIPFRLDWLFLKQLEALDWNVDSVRYSDRRGIIWARVTP